MHPSDEFKELCGKDYAAQSILFCPNLREGDAVGERWH